MYKKTRYIEVGRLRTHGADTKQSTRQVKGTGRVLTYLVRTIGPVSSVRCLVLRGDSYVSEGSEDGEGAKGGEFVKFAELGGCRMESSRWEPVDGTNL